eukprot:TRINITY_DN72855_c0_g1_i1.p1 TRINITY_DN72855_c0_g1~~TRINITY_DN72855_c0_g1_i1.p1  ORF type:complete len:149 (+),score=41.30 TRINITY_DN72855_c0_g1_i1:91-537(+)
MAETNKHDALEAAATAREKNHDNGEDDPEERSGEQETAATASEKIHECGEDNPEERSGEKDKAQTLYCARASRMKQIKEQQRALDEEMAPLPGLVAPGRAPREQALVPASIEPEAPEHGRRTQDGSWRRYIFESIACCASSGRHNGYR